MRRGTRSLAVLATVVLGGCTTGAQSAPEPAAPSVTLENTRVAQYAAGQHTAAEVDYAETPPVGGPHDPVWADCTGSVYDVAIRPENAVHSLEHGAVWITYDPALLAADDVTVLATAVRGTYGLMMSPYPGLGTAVSLQAWNHALRLDDVDDPRLVEFTRLLTGNPENTPEPGAPCENPAFLATPRTA
ncbi:DUF3105 domain-containing protein [Geodermatophilus sp. SYSU D00708]